MRTFKTLLGITIVLLAGFPASRASDGNPDDRNKNYELIEKFKLKNLDRSEKVSLASEMLEKSNFKDAQTIYDEVGVDTQRDTYKNVYNYGISLLGNHQVEKGLSVLRSLEAQEKAKGNLELVDKINRNVLHFMIQEAKRKQEQREKEENEEKQSQNKKKQNQQGNGDEKNNKKGDGQNDQAQNQPQNKPSDGNEKEEKKENKPSEQNDQGQDQNMSWQEKQKKEKQRRTTIKIPGLLKQLLSDDKNLQKRMYSTDNSQRNKLQGSKDW